MRKGGEGDGVARTKMRGWDERVGANLMLLEKNKMKKIEIPLFFFWLTRADILQEQEMFMEIRDEKKKEGGTPTTDVMKECCPRKYSWMKRSPSASAAAD